MKLQIDNRIEKALRKCATKYIIIIGSLLFSSPVHAGLVVEDPALMAAVLDGFALQNKAILSSTGYKTALVAEEIVMQKQLTAMRRWEAQYNSYLKTAAGYAQSLRAGMGIYNQGIESLRLIWLIEKGIANNPSGAFASTNLQLDLYLRTAASFAKSFSIMRNIVAGKNGEGGEMNMLNGRERTQVLWDAYDCLVELNKNLSDIHRYIYYYNLLDIWNKALEGRPCVNKKMVANQCLERWCRAATSSNSRAIDQKGSKGGLFI